MWVWVWMWVCFCVSVMGKFLQFQIINFVRALYLFQVFSTKLQTKVSWALSVRKTSPWCNSPHQKFGNGVIYSLAFHQNRQYEDFRVVGCKAKGRFIFLLIKNIQFTSWNLEWSRVMVMLWVHSSSNRTSDEGQHQVPGGGWISQDWEGGCWKTICLVIGFCTLPHKQKNQVLAVRNFLQPHYP